MTKNHKWATTLANSASVPLSVPASEPCTDCPDSLSAAPAPDGALPSEWHGVITVEGLRTTDHRAIARGSLTWRQLPLPLFAQFLNAGHGDAPIVGQITDITRDGDMVMGQGTFDLSSDAGRQAAAMCESQTLRWGSVDLEVLESQMIEVSTSADGGDDLLDILFGEEGDSADSDWYDEVTLGRIAGYTMVPIPAFPQAVIAPLGVPLDIPEPMGSAPMVAPGMMASAIVAKPPASWFADPALSGPTPLHVSDDGRVFGHLALWRSCHIGFQDQCVTAPRSGADYAYFRTGNLKAADGAEIRVGQLTFDTGHASATASWQDTTAHYDNTGTAAADVVVGEDSHGIWFAGALRAGLSDDDLRAIRASSLSGDWRKIGGGLELVAALCVNTPGFPIVASAGMREHEQVSLITAGIKAPDRLEAMAKEIATLRRAMAPLMMVAAERLSSRVNAKPTLSGSQREHRIGELSERVNQKTKEAV